MSIERFKKSSFRQNYITRAMFFYFLLKKLLASHKTDQLKLNVINIVTKPLVRLFIMYSRVVDVQNTVYYSLVVLFWYHLMALPRSA